MAGNTLLLILDTARARSCYPETSETTPTIRQLATSGRQFTNAISPYPWSLASHASMFTGKYATEHGATTENRYLDPEIPVLAEALRSEGITTGVFTGNLYLSETFGLERGFEHTDFMKGRGAKYFADGFDPLAFHMREGEFETARGKFRAIAKELADGNPLKNVVNGAYFKLFDPSTGNDVHTAKAYDRRAQASAAAFIERQAERDNRFFAVVNLLGAHAPWPFDPEKLRAIGVEPSDVAPRAKWEKAATHSADRWQYIAGDVSFDETEKRLLRLLYESWIHETDGVAGELVRKLDECGVRDETFVILTSDHGEMVCENGVLGHNITLDGPATRVPLVVDGPSTESTVHDRPVSLKNIYGTVLSRMGVNSDAPTLTEDDEYVLSETHGSDPDRVSRIDEDYPNRDSVRPFFQLRRALFTDDGWIEKRYGDDEIRGNDELMEALEDAVSNLDAASQSESDPQLETAVQKRLRDLGYAE